MTKDEIMRLAREACFRTGFISLSSGETLPFIAPVNATSCIVELERFAALVAAKEREACAQLCDLEATKWPPYPSHANAAVTVAATAIRARQEMK